MQFANQGSLGRGSRQGYWANLAGRVGRESRRQLRNLLFQLLADAIATIVRVVLVVAEGSNAIADNVCEGGEGSGIVCDNPGLVEDPGQCACHRGDVIKVSVQKAVYGGRMGWKCF